MNKQSRAFHILVITLTISAIAAISAIGDANSAGLSRTIHTQPAIYAGLAANIKVAAQQMTCTPTGLRYTDETLLPPDYVSFVPPDIGQSYCDPTFGTEIKRLTDSGKGYVTNSEISYFNIDDSYFIISDDNIGSLMNGGDGHKIKPLGGGNMRPWWIRWPRANYYTASGHKEMFDPAQNFYKYEGNEIRLYDVDTLDYVVIRKFSQYTEIDSAGGEGDISSDGRYWILDGTKPDGQQVLFSYDLLDDIKGPESDFDTGCIGCKGKPGVDYASISPSGVYIVIAWDAGQLDPFNGHYGIEVFERRNWNFVRRIHPSRIHFEMGYDSLGNEVMFAAAGNTPDEILSFNIPDLALGDIISVRLNDGLGRKLLDIPKWAHYIISFANGQNHFIFLAFEAKSDSPSELWSPYWGEIIAVPTDGSGEAVRLIHHRSRKVGDQSTMKYQVDFIANNAGTKIAFKSTYGVGGADVYFFDFDWNENSPTFVDVPFSHLYHDEIEVLYQEGYVAGCNLDPLMYCPDDAMNRAESAVFVERGIHTAEYMPTQPTTQVFADVALDQWYAKWANGLWEDGYTAGCGVDPLIYCPLLGHTRAEGCVFYLRMMHGVDYLPPDPTGIFVDAPVTEWYTKWVEAAYNAGLIEPCQTSPEMRFCPNDPLSRGLGAYMMVNSKGLPLP